MSVARELFRVKEVECSDEQLENLEAADYRLMVWSKEECEQAVEWESSAYYADIEGYFTVRWNKPTYVKINAMRVKYYEYLYTN